MSRQVHDAVITSGTALSSIIDCGGGYTVTAIEIPATWTTADLTIQAATHTGKTTPATFGQSPQDQLEGVLTFRDLYDTAGTEFKITLGVTGNKIVYIADGLLDGIQFLKIRSGTSAAPVNQAGDRTLRVVLSAAI